jgi:Ni/Fe-hydrogenase subunit HybB-like protein
MGTGIRAIGTRAPNLTREFGRFVRFFLAELRPKGPVLTPFNVITAVVLVATAVLLTIRFIFGLGSITNLSQDVPWGLWIGFDVVAGVAFAGGAYVITFLVYILRVEKYRPILRVTVLNGFLAYAFYTGALLLDLGRPWNVVNPIIGNSFGVSSVLFLVAWHFLLYLIALFFEFSPAVAEWLGWDRVRRTLNAATLGGVIFGITLSILHQSGLGALYLLARDKIHPLWYSEFIPLLFLVSSIFAGLSMVIVEGSVTQRIFHHRVGTRLKASHDDIVFGLARISTAVMFVYLFMHVLVFVHGRRGPYLATGWGAWYVLEMAVFTAVPAVLYGWGCQRRRLSVVRIAAVMAMVGILLNRLNVSIIAFKWYAPVRYVPSWMEIVVTLGVLSAELWIYRWVVNRMPVLDFGTVHGERPVAVPTAARPAA